MGVFGGQVANSWWGAPHGHPGLCIVGATNSAQGSQQSLHREGTFMVQLGNRETRDEM